MNNGWNDISNCLATKWSFQLSLARGALRRCAVDLGAVGKAGVPTAPALRSEVHEVPDGSEQIDAALFDVWRHARMRTIEMAQGAVGIAGENGNRGVLMPVAVFAAQVVLEGAGATTQESQPVPTSAACMRAQSDRTGRGHDRNVDVLGQVMCDTIPSIDDKRAHRARLGLLLSVHEVIDHNRPIWFGE